MRVVTAVAAVTLPGWASTPAASAVPAGPAALAAHAAHAGLPVSAKSRLLAQLLKAWRITRGDGVTVAVLSTGVDQVSDLTGKLRHGPDFAPLAGAPATDGTVLSSMIAGSGPTSANPFGAIGVAPGAKILAERIVAYGAGRAGLKYEAGGTWQKIMAKAIRYAVNHGASVIVTFEHGYVEAPVLDAAVAYAVSKRVVVLGSNQVFGRHPNGLTYPDSLPGVINFSGSTLKGLPAPHRPVRQPANSSVLVTAPDNTRNATGPGNAPYVAWGPYTSIAWMAGTVALIKSVYPHITPAQVARALAVSASYHPAGGYNVRVGFGLINPIGALHAAGNLVRLHSTASPGHGVVGADTRFGSGGASVVQAVQHSPVTLGGYSAAILAGIVLLALAARLARRRRRAPDTSESNTVATV